MDEECENNNVHEIRLGEREGFSNQSRQSLAQGAVETFDMVGIGFGLALGELIGLDDFGVSFPYVGIAVRLFVRSGNRLPQLAAGSGSPVSHHKRHNLPRAPTERQPNPALVFAPFDKAPNLV